MVDFGSWPVPVRPISCFKSCIGGFKLASMPFRAMIQIKTAARVEETKARIGLTAGSQALAAE